MRKFQCPNPDFNKPENRWKMVTRMLVEAVSDLLALNGKVRILSDHGLLKQIIGFSWSSGVSAVGH